MTGQSRVKERAKPGGTTARPRVAQHDPEVRRALTSLAQAGKVAGVRSLKVSARVDPAILAAAAVRLGLKDTDISEVINASLTLVAAPDPFKAWWKDPGPPLPDDFELAI